MRTRAEGGSGATLHTGGEEVYFIPHIMGIEVDMMMKMEEKDAYAVLGVSRDADERTIRRAYHKLALRMHPDKVQARAKGLSQDGTTEEAKPVDLEEAKIKFQQLQKIFQVLSDPDRRAQYDETGSLDDDDDSLLGSKFAGKDFSELYAYYRSVFAKVTEEDIAAFELKYRGSEEESRDLLDLYEKHEGRMNLVFSYLLCSRPGEDAERFASVIDAAVGRGDAAEHASYARWRKALRKKAGGKHHVKSSSTKKDTKSRRAKLGGVRKSKEGEGGMSALTAQIQGRHAGRMEDLLGSLEAKYGGGGGGKAKAKKKKVKGEPTEEEFERARARIGKKKAAAASS